MTGDLDADRPAKLTLKDKLVAVGIATVLIAIILAIFRLGLGFLYGWGA